MVKCQEFYEQFNKLREMAKHVKGYCEVDAKESIRRFTAYNKFCKTHALTPFGVVPEGALRPLIKERNEDIAPIVVERIKKRMKSKSPKDSQITNSIVRRLIAEVRRNSIDTPPFPKKKYRCLVIDPPWPTEKIVRESRPHQGVELDYPTMSLEQIAELPILDLANSEGCHVFLWVTHKFLPKGLELFNHWGVKYQCVLTWVKPTGMTPFSWMYNTEHVLFGRIGHLLLLQNGIKLSFNGSLRKHSKKPNIFYEIVSTVSPPPRLELFARDAHDGFDLWGNEAKASNAL